MGVDASLGNGCRIQEHLHSFRKVKYFQSCSKTFWMDISNCKKTVISEFSLEVIIVVSQPGKLGSNPRRKQFFISPFMNFVFKSNGG